MRIIRVAPPAIISSLLLVAAFQSTARSLGNYDESTIQAFRTGLLPAAVGVALLLAALEIARGSRAGYFLGLAVAAFMVLMGVALIAIEIPFLGQGGISGAVVIPLMVVSVVWCLLWIGYGQSFRRSRASFAATSGPADRRMGIVLAALAIFSAGAYVGLGAIDATTAANQAIDQARAAALIAETSLTVDVKDVRVGTPDGAAGTSQPVQHLTLELTISSTTFYLLAAEPRLCLTDVATYRDPAFKPDVYCWGSPDPNGALAAAFGDAIVPSDGRKIRLDLDRSGSLCPFAAGSWNAALTLGPQLGATPGGGVGPAPETYTISTVFEVASATVSPPDPAGPSCIDATVSP